MHHRHSTIKSTDRITFFPTLARRLSDQTWRITIHGWIYRPAELSHLRRVAVHFARHLLRVPVDRSDPQMPLFRRRMGAMLADNSRGRRIRITFDGTPIPLKKSRASGHFQTSLDIPLQESQSAPAGPSSNWMRFHNIPHDPEARIFEGRILLLPDTGLSVISDIDDTIKISEVLDGRRLVKNTFLNDFTSVPDMAALYQRLAQRRDAAFHYVSASPWHLYPFLAEFLQAEKFPPGTFHLRDFRLMPPAIAKSLRSSARVKARHIESLLDSYRERRFILIGDSGQADPETYARFARARPGQIEKILIRNITDEPPAAARWQNTFRELPKNQWQVFDSPAQIPL